MKKIYLILYIMCFTLIVLMSTSFVVGQGLDYDLVSYSDNESSRANTPFFNIGIFNNKTYTINYQNFAVGFQFFFDLIIGISIATAVIVFMVGAFEGIVNKNVVKDQVEAKQRMTRSIVGLMIILSTWLIINTINPDLLRLPIFQGLDGLKANEQSSGAQTGVTGSSAGN